MTNDKWKIENKPGFIHLGFVIQLQHLPLVVFAEGCDSRHSAS